MKWSYVISIIVGIILFCILYIGLEFGIAFSLIISVIAYFACTMIFKERDTLQEKIDSDAFEFQKLTNNALVNIKKIEAIKNEIDNRELVENIGEICSTSRKIVDTIKENPKKARQINKFVDYYLPLTLNILTQYNKIEDQNLTSKESKEFLIKVEKMIQRVKEACEVQLNKMYETDLVNTNADIKVFETMLKTDGLVDDNMNIKIDGK